MDVNLPNPLISVFPHEQCEQLKSVQITFGSYKTQCFKNLAKINRLVDSYQRYRSYSDQKAEAQPLKLHSHCLLLNPRLTRQNDFTQKAVQTWLPFYGVEKVLTNSNYIIRKTGTIYTQYVHRIRLRPIKLTEPPEDIQENDPAKFEADPSRRTTRTEPELFDE